MVPTSQKYCTYNFSLPTHQLTNLQITAEDALHASLCTEEHMCCICEKLPKAVSFTSVCITFNIIVGISADKASAHNCRTFSQSIHFPWSQASTEVSTQPPERCTPLCTLTHSLKRFRTSIFEFGEVLTFRNRPFVFLPHAATPLG